MENKFKITCDKENIRLDIFLSERLSITRTKVKDIIEDGHVRIAGKIPKPSLKTRSLMEIEGEIPEEEPLSLTPQAIPLEVLYEDEYFLVINKPKGMVVHPSVGHREGTLVNAILAYIGQGAEEIPCAVRHAPAERNLETQHSTLNTQHFASAIHRPGIVHRLDKGTTGVIIVAKDSKTQEMLSALFKKRAMQKTYRAVVEGNILNNKGTIEGNIGRHPTDRKRMAVLKEGGRDAVTSIKVIVRLNGFTYIEAYPKTGRTHQIRVHLSHTGHPVAGDDTYGKKAKHIIDRPLLHAYKIEFIHPVKNIPVSVEAPVPGDMIDFIEKYTLSQ